MDSMDNFFLNNPIFLKYKRRFDLKKFRRVPYLKKAIINERIIEIPFVLTELSNVAPASRILDLGCMESMLPLFMAAAGYQVTGFDFREYPYRVPNFSFVQGDILNLPFPDHEFDAVTCVSTIEHVGIGFYRDPTSEKNAPDAKGIAQARRVLKRRGLFLLTVPFGKPHENNQQRVYDKLGIDRLLYGFDVQKMQFYKNVHPVSGNNYWEEIRLDEAEGIFYETGTECVCCVSAANQS